MSHLSSWSKSDRFNPQTIIYCHMDLSFKFSDGTEIKIKHTLRPFNRDINKYYPMNQNQAWCDRYAHEFVNNRDKFKDFFASFLEARKLLAEELAAGNELLTFYTRYYACDETHAGNAKVAYVGDEYAGDCEDPVAAAKEVSDWVKHTMAYAG